MSHLVEWHTYPVTKLAETQVPSLTSLRHHPPCQLIILPLHLLLFILTATLPAQATIFSYTNWGSKPPNSFPCSIAPIPRFISTTAPKESYCSPPESFLCLSTAHRLRAFLRSLAPQFPHALLPASLSSLISHAPQRGPLCSRILLPSMVFPTTRVPAFTMPSSPPPSLPIKELISHYLPGFEYHLILLLSLCSAWREMTPAAPCLQKYMAVFWHQSDSCAYLLYPTRLQISFSTVSPGPSPRLMIFTE